MKHTFRHIILVLLLATPFFAAAQKYACVNTEYILSNIPDYSRAQSQLNKQAETWQKEVEAKFQEIDRLYKAYHQEAYLLPDNLKHKRQDEITAKELEAKELQTKYFGPGGDLDRKRAELMKPIQDRVYNAIERIANEKNYAFILDKSGSATLLYVSAKYDISDQVLDMLGYKAGAAKADEGNRGGGERTESRGDRQDRNTGDRPNPTKKEVGNPEMKRPQMRK